MKLSGMLLIVMMTMGGIGYWYYTDTQKTIAVLTENNAKLNLAVATNEATIQAIVFVVQVTPIGTNLGLANLMWAMSNGSFLLSRGCYFPGAAICRAG